jgi:23S rRNA (pseudouridine1915-N3)-methyltransferase
VKLTLAAFGKLKTPGLREAADYYLKLLRGFFPGGELELRPLPVPEKSTRERDRIRAKEALLLLERLEKAPGRTAFFLLDETGEALTTRQWAKRLASLREQGLTEVFFCVGSSLGLDPALREKARGVFSLGPQTLPHELARVVLCEQLYRASSLLHGHPYHND